MGKKVGKRKLKRWAESGLTAETAGKTQSSGELPAKNRLEMKCRVTGCGFESRALRSQTSQKCGVFLCASLGCQITVSVGVGKKVGNLVPLSRSGTNPAFFPPFSRAVIFTINHPIPA